MKKALALLLSIIAVFSMFGVVACAADAEEPDTDGLVVILFCNEDGAVISRNYYTPGTILEKDKFPEYPTKESTATTEYILKGWRCNLDGELYYKEQVYQISAEAEGREIIIFTAEYSEKEITATQSFWNFVESVFARINLIFQYFAKIFEW